MWHALLDDAERFDIPWPMARKEIDAAFACARQSLDEIDTPRLVHFDLWDGNVMIGNARRITGVIDWERAFFGDPLAEIVSLHFFDNADEDRALFEGLEEGSRRPLALDTRAKQRLALYRAYLWMIMIVEAVPRGFGGSIRLAQSSAARRFCRDLAIAAGLSG
jgi:aminoglycoside phosphotransferase (APT) family kinase protein